MFGKLRIHSFSSAYRNVWIAGNLRSGCPTGVQYARYGLVTGLLVRFEQGNERCTYSNMYEDVDTAYDVGWLDSESKYFYLVYNYEL
jgi:hypothetical protein